MSIDELLDSYRNLFALTEREKGDRFERLMKNFLLTYPPYRGEISNVWLWKDFPYKNNFGGKDLGIDIVAKTFDGNFWAIQCKFYAESSTIDKPAVDSFFANATRNFDGKKFSTFVWICTTDKYTDNAREMFKGRTEKILIIGIEDLRKAAVDWQKLDAGIFGKKAILPRELRDYQIDAIQKADEHFKKFNRGKLIMACGTGKTFTALKIAEKIFPNGKILFLVPSISLLSQTLEEWATFSEKPLNAVCVCSDETAADKSKYDAFEVNLPLPAMTDENQIAAAIKNFSNDNMTVIFSTYQSLDKVIAAQKIFDAAFDLIICDEAHRTTGYSDKDDKAFTKVHEDKNILAKKRLYMTATPRMFSSSALERKNESTLTLWSMDDENIFGKEIYSISFKKAIEKGCLTDYKVLVLTIPERSLRKKLIETINDKNSLISTDDALKLVGCINALSKKCDEHSRKLLADDLSLMNTAVAFCSTIKNSKKLQETFAKVQADYKADLSDEEKENLVNAMWYHVDGAMKSSDREKTLAALKNTSRDENICRIVSNVRCLSEGVDVPALDAVIFLAPKKSRVEIVQAVGRAMRIAKNKKFGYIIIPVVIPISKDPDQILASSEFKEVWQIINALRAHDERIDIWIEQIRMKQKNKSENKNSDDEPTEGEEHLIAGTTNLADILLFDEMHDKIFARMVDFVGNPRYWTEWAIRIKNIVERHTKRIKEIISVPGSARTAFIEFHCGLQKNLNPSVTENEVVDMLAQHLVTRPVFEALFDSKSFAQNNPVSIAMQKILDELDKDGMNKDHEIFEKLYNQVRDQCKVTDNPKTRQEIITRLYDSFFRLALPTTAQKLGIVYTPVEVVDFILNSVNDVLHKNFGKTFSDKNVHILDPFTGTGTFITRLLTSGLIDKNILKYKYQNEIHANEIVLLAYYIAAVNIENTFNSTNLNYLPYNLICFTDTFQTYENDEKTDTQTAFYQMRGPLEKNSERINDQLEKKIQIIIGNPPYSVGQRSANDNAQNNYYAKIEQKISETYAANTTATNKNSLYDSYIKAFLWASDRIGDSGIIGFVTNAGWLDGAAMDGLRKCFVKEFSEIYIFNLRGNARTQGEIRRKEACNVFGSGSRAPIAITILVKNQTEGDAKIFYCDIGDYLSREQKLEKISAFKSVLNENFKPLIPNDKGDWINQRGNDFDNFLPLAPDKKFNLNAESFFIVYSRGICSDRDYWVYNFSRKNLKKNIQTTIEFFNENMPENVDSTKITWTRATKQNKARGKKYLFDEKKIVTSMYRPFCEENFYYDENLNEMMYLTKKLFPTGKEENLIICMIFGDRNFSVFISKKICDVQFQFNGQCFSRYYYETSEQGNLFADASESYIRRDNISDHIKNLAAKKYGISVCTKNAKNNFCTEKNKFSDEIFYYVYGFLHLPSYREKFSAELKKSLPRIFLIDDAKKFWQLVKAGRDLAEIHLNYETQTAANVEVIISKNDYRVKKMRLNKDAGELIYNEFITVKNIPPRSFDYVVNGRSPLEWIVERYQVKVDKASGIENNPNDWCDEHGDEKYILKLILSSIAVSLKTLDIVENLPTVEF